MAMFFSFFPAPLVSVCVRVRVRVREHECERVRVRACVRARRLTFTTFLAFPPAVSRPLGDFLHRLWNPNVRVRINNLAGNLRQRLSTRVLWWSHKAEVPGIVSARRLYL